MTVREVRCAWLPDFGIPREFRGRFPSFQRKLESHFLFDRSDEEEGFQLSLE
jgi:hypothetical protein